MPRTDDDTCPAEDGNAPSPLVAHTIFNPFLLRIVVTDDGFCLGISLLDLDENVVGGDDLIRPFFADSLGSLRAVAQPFEVVSHQGRAVAGRMQPLTIHFNGDADAK